MENTSVEELIKLKKQELRRSMEKLDADNSRILTRIPRLKGLLERNQMVKVNIEKRSQELEAKEKELQSWSLELEERCQNVEKEKAEASNLKKLMEECTEQLKSKTNQLTAMLASLEKTQRDLESKSKQLRDIARHCVETRQAEDRKRKVEGETDEKKKELALILEQIKESDKQLVTVDEQLESRSKALEIVLLKIVSKERELECLRESIKLSNSDLELKETNVESLKSCIAVCGEEIGSKSKELGEIQKLIEKQTNELCVMQNQRDSTQLLIRKLSEELVAKENRHTEILETLCRCTSEMEERAKQIKTAETEANDLIVKPEKFKQEVECKKKELELLKNQIESEEKKLVQLKREMEEETDSKKKDLVLIISKIEESGKQLAAMDEKVESRRRLLELQPLELVSRDMELECVGESSNHLKFDLEVKEKWVQALNYLIRITEERLDSKSEELWEIQNELTRLRKSIEDCMPELNSRRDQLEVMKSNVQREDRLKRQLRQMMSVLVRHVQHPASAPINDTSQENAIETEVDIEDALTHYETSDLLDCDDVSSVLKDSVNPAEFVLELVEEQLREEVDLHDSLMANWVVLFEELAKIQRSDDTQVQHKAKKVATLWKKKIATRAPKSSLEVLAFLLFIVTYGLKILLHSEFILELVEEEIREEVDLHDSLIKKWVLLFEELARIQRSDDPQVQHKATQVATLWKRKIAIEAPKSSLEVLAFLMFVVEYGLKEVINEEETALLASSIAQYEQSPRLFISLGLRREIRECVKDLIKKSLYIPAVRLICLHKLNEEFLPSELLVKEINNLKQSALQGKDKDVGRLRAILELVAIYKLEIDLPGDLVVKLVVQREDLTPPVVQCNVKYGNSPNSASAQCSSMNLRVPEVKPYLKPIRQW